MAKIESRPVAPEVMYDDIYVDRRKAFQDKLNEKDPDFVYAYQRGDIKDSELRSKNQEVVKDENGEPVKFGDDLVVKMPKSWWIRKQEADSLRSVQQVTSVVDAEKATVFRKSEGG